MSKKGILACFMAVCMLLISMVSVSAASVTYTVEPWIENPQESYNITYSGLAYSSYNTKGDFDFLFINANEFGLTTEMTGNSDPAKFFAQKVDYSNLLKGAFLTADVTYYPNAKTNDRETKVTYHIENVPVTGCYPSGDLTKLRLGVEKANIVANCSNVVLSDGTVETTPTVEQICKTICDAGTSFSVTNAVLKPGTAPLYKGGEKIISTGTFPQGTMFMAAEKFVDTSSKITPATEGSDWGGYYFFNPTSVCTPSATCISTGTGEYEVWALVVSHTAENHNRIPSITINGATGVYDALPNAASSKQAAWAKLKNYTVNLTEGQLISVSVNCNYTTHGRFGGLAFVPVNADTKPSEANYFITTSGAEGCIAASDLALLHEVTTNALQAGPSVENVEVRYDKITVPAWSAKDKGALVPTVDATGAALVNATVTDALYAKSILPRTDGKQLIITLNGKKVVNPDVTYIKSGDVIDAEPYSDGFSPIRITDAATAGGDSAFENLFASGTDGANMRIVFKPTFFTDTKKLDVKTNDLLTGAHFNGYMKPRMAGTTEKLGTMNGYGMMRNQTFDSVNYEYTKSDGNVVYEATASGDTKVVSYEGNKNVSRVQHIVNGEVIGVLPYRISGDPYDYFYSTMYITDSKVYVVNNGTHHLITVDGCDDLYILIKTDNGDGTYTTTIQNKVVMFNDPYALTLADNQTAYIWQNINYSGTTMIPLCEVITNSAE